MVKVKVAEFNLMVGLGRFYAGLGLVSATALSGGAAAPAFADSFHLKNGQIIEGTVLKGTLNTLTLAVDSSVQLTSIGLIERVVLDLADGSEVTGELLSWRDGVFELRSDGDVVRIADGALLEEGAAGDETTVTAAPAEEAVATTSDEPVVAESLPSFSLKNGEVIIGEVLHATGSVLTIRPAGGSATPISRAQIETVNFENADGARLSGKLLDWQEGVYHLDLDDREMLISLVDDAVIAPSQSAAATEPAEQDLDTPVAAEIEQADAAILPPSGGEQPSESADAAPVAEVGAGGPANETEVAALDAANDEPQPAAAAADASQHRIDTLVDPVDEGSGSVVFKFQLNKPAERPLVVLYAATEASAQAGNDFEAKSGVITFSTGSTYAEVQVPIIDDQESEDSETFNLFLSGDPKTIAFSQRQIAVTINDND